MICKVQFEYQFFKELMPPERYHVLRRIIPKLPLEQPIKEHQWEHYDADILELAKSGFKFEVVGMRSDESMTFACKIAESMNRIELAIKNNPTYRPGDINLKIEQSQDAFLHRITKVEVLEDCCTDTLQDKLNEGFRIVAVCYQKMARRPDYVIGKPDEEPKKCITNVVQTPAAELAPSTYQPVKDDEIPF